MALALSSHNAVLVSSTVAAVPFSLARSRGEAVVVAIADVDADADADDDDV